MMAMILYVWAVRNVSPDQGPGGYPPQALCARAFELRRALSGRRIPHLQDDRMEPVRQGRAGDVEVHLIVACHRAVQQRSRDGVAVENGQREGHDGRSLALEIV